VGSFDERAVADPYVIRVEPYFYMYYLGQDRAVRQRIGLARSTDGIRWEKLRANPVLELDLEHEAGLGEPAVWQSDGFYWMLFTVRNFDETRYLGLARSTDGVHWTRLPVRYTGNQPWNAKVLCDPSVVVDGGAIEVWFGGGDVASPDENLHGQIGFATLVK
jgi:sucrose-6-phosphate hydrolase SacC (GH32 family)